MKHFTFLLIAALAGNVGYAQTYNYFPPPGYNCSVGPPAQIPFASTANKLLCTSLLSWNNSTDVLNVGAATTPGTFSVGALDSMVINGVTVPIPGFAINSNIQGVIENHSYVAGGPTGGARYYGVRSRGTISAPAIVQNGDNLTSWYAAGYNGSSYSLGAQILAQVTGTPGASAMPTDLDFLVSPAGSQTPTSRLRIKNDGSLSISGSVGTAGQALLSGGPGVAAAWGAPAAATILDLAHGGANVVTPSNTGWTLEANGGTFTESTGANGQLVFNASTVAAPFPFGYRKTYGGGNFDIAMYVTNPTQGAFGVFVRDSATGNVTTIGSGTNSLTAPDLINFTSPAGTAIGTWSFSATVGTYNNNSPPQLSYNTTNGWYRFTRVTNTYQIYISVDGANWVALSNSGLTTAFAASPNQFGLYFNVNGASLSAVYTLWSLSGI